MPAVAYFDDYVVFADLANGRQSTGPASRSALFTISWILNCLSLLYVAVEDKSQKNVVSAHPKEKVYRSSFGGSELGRVEGTVLVSWRKEVKRHI